MPTKHALDPELAAALAELPRGANGSFMDLTDIPALRTQLAQFVAQTPSPASSDSRVVIDTIGVDRPDGSVLDVVVVRPAGRDAPQPALLWFHAGGQVVGRASDDVDLAVALALSVDCVVGVVDYRLAPDTPSPGAAEDGALGYTHIHEHASELGLIADRIGLAGASGGGAIAAATALIARDRQAQMPRLLSLSYPMLDDRNETPSSHEVTDIGVFDRRENLLAWDAVLGDRVGAPDLDPHAAPGRATDLHGFPPTFIGAAQYDVFRDEDITFARRLLEAGVPTDLHVYGGAFHAWDLFAPDTALAAEYRRTWHNWLRRHLHT